MQTEPRNAPATNNKQKTTQKAYFAPQQTYSVGGGLLSLVSTFFMNLK